MLPEQFKQAISSGIVVDTRMPASFSAHVPGSYNIWLDGLAIFSKWINDHEKPVYLILERDTDVETASKHVHVAGSLSGGFQTWAIAGYDIEFMGLLVPDALAGMLSEDKVTLIDVRNDAQWKCGRIKEAMHIDVSQLEGRLNEVPKTLPVVCICGTGLSSSFAASILRKAGFKDVYSVLGGIAAWKAKDYPLLYERLLEK